MDIHLEYIQPYQIKYNITKLEFQFIIKDTLNRVEKIFKSSHNTKTLKSTRMGSPANKMLTICVVILKMKTPLKIDFINNSHFFFRVTYECATCISDIKWWHQRISDLEIELQMVMVYHVSTRNRTWDFCKINTFS